ncbi:MAG: hypothetical protein Q8O66_02255 [bacterium]|nr:hypothetical protein [bacterium]
MGSRKSGLKAEKTMAEEARTEEEKIKLPNQCLGSGKAGNRCEKRLPKGKHLCSRCQRNINSASRKRGRISSGNGNHYIRNTTIEP